MTENRKTLGILLMMLVSLIFAVQDAMSRYMAENVSVLMVVMIRYWFFASFVTLIALRSGGGLRHAMRSRYPVWQVVRGLLLIAQICVMITAFTLMGLSATHAVFSSYPLLTTALAVPILGEVAGWRRWSAVVVGFIGVLIILNPGSGVFSAAAILPIAGALMFAAYSLMTRFVARGDASLTSVLWTSIVGAAVMTPLGLANWSAMTPAQWGIMGLLCLTATSGHWLLIRVYEIAEVGVVQPFAYFQLVFVTIIGVTFFSEVVTTRTMAGTAIVVAAGIFTLMRARKRREAG